MSKAEPARFDSNCPKCNDEIVTGEAIIYDDEYEAWTHEACTDWEEQDDE